MAENTFASRLETLEEKVQSLESTVVRLLNEIKKLKGEEVLDKPKAKAKPKAKVVELPVEEKKKVTKKKTTKKE